MVSDRFEEAVRTLRRLDVGRTKPMGYFSTWPEMVYDAWEVMAMDKLPIRLGPPQPDAISRMEKTLNWLWWLEKDECMLIWWRAENKPWKPICCALGCGRKKAWEMRNKALEKVAYRLERNI